MAQLRSAWSHCVARVSVGPSACGRRQGGPAVSSLDRWVRGVTRALGALAAGGALGVFLATLLVLVRVLLVEQALEYRGSSAASRVAVGDTASQARSCSLSCACVFALVGS